MMCLFLQGDLQGGTRVYDYPNWQYAIPHTAYQLFLNRSLLVLHPSEQGKPTKIPLSKSRFDWKEGHFQDRHKSGCHHPNERSKPVRRTMSSLRRPTPSQTERDGNKQSACQCPSFHSHKNNLWYMVKTQNWHWNWFKHATTLQKGNLFPIIWSIPTQVEHSSNSTDHQILEKIPWVTPRTAITTTTTTTGTTNQLQKNSSQQQSQSPNHDCTWRHQHNRQQPACSWSCQKSQWPPNRFLSWWTQHSRQEQQTN